jgi:hypothetical protein
MTGKRQFKTNLCKNSEKTQVGSYSSKFKRERIIGKGISRRILAKIQQKHFFLSTTKK